MKPVLGMIPLSIRKKTTGHPLQKSEKRHFCINGKERLFLIPHCDHNEGTTGLKIFSFSQVLSLLLT